MTARADFLARIRREVAKAPGQFAAATAPRPAHPSAAADAIWRELAERWSQALDHFREEFERIAGVFHRVPTFAAVPAVIAAIARERGVSRVVTWDPGALGFDPAPALSREGLAVAAVRAGQEDEAARERHRAEAAAAQIGVTGADFVLAETGTLILRSGAGRPRSTSLLPDVHVAVFGRDRLLETLEQVGVVLEAIHADPDQSTSGAMINFITGPSRTADIELTLTRGVHGPKEVHAIFVEAP
ncbi:MAG TPA: lactate utilization protein [Methylomirabilota bacterium]|jgi:L-lactate dehydrogenase complex protein LldG